MEWSWLVRTLTHRALARFWTGATPTIKKTTWPSCVAECWWSWWQRCRRWRWTRPSWAVSGLTIQGLWFQLLRQDLVNISTASGPSSFSTLMSRGSKRFQGTSYMSFYPHISSFHQHKIFFVVSVSSSHLSNDRVEQLRERVYASLEEYTRWTSFTSFLTNYAKYAKMMEEYTRWTFLSSNTPQPSFAINLWNMRVEFIKCVLPFKDNKRKRDGQIRKTPSPPAR